MSNKSRILNCTVQVTLDLMVEMVRLLQIHQLLIVVTYFPYLQSSSAFTLYIFIP